MFMDYYAEQSCTAGRTAFITGMHPLRAGMIATATSGQPVLPAAGHADAAKFLLDLGYNTGEFGKNHLGDHTESLPTAHGFQEFWGYLYHLDAMQAVSFPDINKTPTEQAIAPPCKNTPIPGLAEVPAAVDPEDHDLPDAAASDAVVQVVRRQPRQPDLRGRGSADAGALEEPWTRRSRPRSSTSSTATTPRRPASRSSSGTTRRACTSRTVLPHNTRPCWASPAARTGASTKPA